MKELQSRIGDLEAEITGLRGDNACLLAVISDLTLGRVLHDAVDTVEVLASATRRLRRADTRTDIADLHTLIKKGLDGLLSNSEFDETASSAVSSAA